jgi:anti-sigma regulatory factor (Ser/Thr protein kinase)
MASAGFEFRMENRWEDFRALLDAADGWAEARSLSGPTRARWRLVLDEIVGNIIRYGEDPSGDGRFDIRVTTHCDAGSLVVGIRDGSVAFDPLAHEPPELDAALEDREIGGLGIHLVRRLAEQVAYRRENGENILDLTLDATSSGSS